MRELATAGDWTAATGFLLGTTQIAAFLAWKGIEYAREQAAGCRLWWNGDPC